MQSIGLLAVLGALMWLVAGCAATGDQAAGSGASRPEPKIVHAVFFTCKPGTPETEVASLIADCQGLSRIPTARKVVAGRRDMRLAREVNDKDFTVGLIVYFDDMAGHDAYQTHPIHDEFVQKHKAHWSVVRVFDFNTR